MWSTKFGLKLGIRANDRLFLDKEFTLRMTFNHITFLFHIALTVFDVMTRKWFTPTILLKGRGSAFVNGAVTRINKNVLVFVGSRWFLGYNYNIMWELSITSAGVWYWLAKPAAANTRISLTAKEISWTLSGMVLEEKHVLVFSMSSFLDNKQPTSLNLLHILDIKSLSWSVDTSEKRPPFKNLVPFLLYFTTPYLLFTVE